MDNRLSKSITPENYDIFIFPDLEKFTFTGKESITLNILKETNKIILHSLNLGISSASLKFEKNTLTPKISFNKENEFLILSFDSPIPKGKGHLEIEFSGKTDDSLSGLYRSKYLDKDKKEKYLLTSQFEAPYARKCFPCFDEPDKKATFKFTLKIPKNLKAISNMPIESETSETKTKTITFQKTPKMSTYLGYLGIGDFEFLEDNYKSIKLRAVTTPGKSKDCKFALNCTKKFLKYFEEFSGIPYPLPKLDILAIPDFSAGAMENWGAITFREIILLHTKNTSAQIEKRIAEVIAHELWHQWSGNLVTMEWWDDLWLNESFANYMAFKALNEYFSEWNNWEDYVNEDTSPALISDSLESTHPILVKVDNTNDIQEIFDEISYNKGGSILRMINSFLGEEKFKEGISEYLNEYKYANAKASDLWNSLSKTLGSEEINIKEIMESWINQKGFPIISVEKEESSIKLSQKRFSKKEHPETWRIPLVINTDKNQINKLFDKKDLTIKLTEKINWFKLNPEATGFYRTKYSESALNSLLPLIKNKSLSPIDRWQIQNDSFHLAYLGFIPLKTYLDLLENYKDEESYMVLSDISINIRTICTLFSYLENSEDKIKPIKEIMIPTFKKVLKDLTWDSSENESKESKFLRISAINYLAFSKDEETILFGLKKFKEFIKNPEKIDKDIKYSLFYIAALNGSSEDYNFLLNLYEKSEDIEEKIKTLSALYRFENSEQINSSLSLALSNKVRLQDLRTVFSTISSNKEYRHVFLQWVGENWDKLSLTKDTHYVFQGLLETLISLYLNDKKQEIDSFLTEKKIDYASTKSKGFERMDRRTQFINKNKDISL